MLGSNLECADCYVDVRTRDEPACIYTACGLMASDYNEVWFDNIFPYGRILIGNWKGKSIEDLS
jgi:hypothetical protein